MGQLLGECYAPSSLKVHQGEITPSSTNFGITRLFRACYVLHHPFGVCEPLLAWLSTVRTKGSKTFGNNRCTPSRRRHGAQTAFAFSILLYPHSRRLSLRFAFPIREKYGLTTFRNSDLTA